MFLKKSLKIFIFYFYPLFIPIKLMAKIIKKIFCKMCFYIYISSKFSIFIRDKKNDENTKHTNLSNCVRTV